jgi:hypothetical protein
MENCINCSNNYCISCGGIDRCYNICNYGSHTMYPETEGKEYKTTYPEKLCCKCQVQDIYPMKLKDCNKNCFIYASVAKSMTIWMCDYHKTL